MKQDRKKKDKMEREKEFVEKELSRLMEFTLKLEDEVNRLSIKELEN